MRTSTAVRNAVAVAMVAATWFGVPSVAHADTLNTPPPTGPGTEKVGPPGLKPGLRPGFEGGVGIGSGFSDTYGVGLEARVGYSFEPGVYAGGAVSYFHGQTIDTETAHATFVGGELGYKYYPDRRFEIRPYVFLGPAFVTQVNTAPFFVKTTTDFAVQPSALVTYHIGDGFFGADVRWLVTPSPTTLAVLASGGFGF